MSRHLITLLWRTLALVCLALGLLGVFEPVVRELAVHAVRDETGLSHRGERVRDSGGRSLDELREARQNIARLETRDDDR